MRQDFNYFHSLRVRYSEIDGQGIVFNAHYMTYMDVAVTEYMRNLGIDFVELAREGKMDMALVKSTLEFKASAYFDDLLEIGVRISSIGNTSYTVEFEIYTAGTDNLVLKGQTVYVNYHVASRKAEPVPVFFRAIAEEFEGRKLS